MKKFPLIMSLLLLTSWAPAAARHAVAGRADGHYRVVHVADGDTFEATDGLITFRVRVAGMDAPEYQQAFGKWATTELKDLIEGKEVVIRSVGRGLDRYNRILGQVFVEETDVSLSMIRRGFAFYYRPQCRDYPQDKRLYEYDPRPYVKAEAEARAMHLVIWSRGPTTLPCQFRRDHPHR